MNKSLSLASLALKHEIRQSDLRILLSFIAKHKKIENNDLVRRLGWPKTLLHNVLADLTDILKPPTKFVELKDDVEISSLIEAKELSIGDHNYKHDIISLLNKYKGSRPTPDRNFDQFMATNATSAKRANLMAKRGDIENREVAIIGDDDLNSISIATVGKANSIVSLEIDDRIIEAVNKISKENSYSVKTVKYDVRDKMPTELVGKFDSVLTDPPYTVNGISLFLNRAIELLKPKLTSRIYLAYGNSDRARERELEIQKCILDRGLLIKEKKYQYCRYYGAESIGSRSSLYILDWTPKTKVVGTELDKRLYTHE